MTVFMQLITVSIIVGLLIGAFIGTVVYLMQKAEIEREREFWEELERRHLDSIRKR